jgi:U3 small nucleolar RNA-associated protein 18
MSSSLPQIDGENNPKVHGIFFQDLPIHKAAFVGDDQVVITGKKPFYYCYDVHSGNVEKVPRVFSSGRGSGSAKESLRNFAASSCGKWLAFPCREGYVMLVSRRTKQWVADFRLNGPADALAFTPDSRFLLASGEDGDIYSFDLRSQRCFLRFQNEVRCAALLHCSDLSLPGWRLCGDDAKNY